MLSAHSKTFPSGMWEPGGQSRRFCLIYKSEHKNRLSNTQMHCDFKYQSFIFYSYPWCPLGQQEPSLRRHQSWGYQLGFYCSFKYQQLGHLEQCWLMVLWVRGPNMTQLSDFTVCEELLLSSQGQESQLEVLLPSWWLRG